MPSTLSPTVLRRRSEFLAIAAHGKKWVTPSFVIQIMPVPAPEPSPRTLHYGLTASKKVGNAVKRNRARRRLRAIVHDMLQQVASSDFRYVLIAREAALTHDYQAMKKDLVWALKKLGVAKS